MRVLRWIGCLGVCLLLLSGGTGAVRAETGAGLSLQYATQFTVDGLAGGCSLLTIAGTEEYLLVPEGAEVPEGTEAEMPRISIPAGRVYVASSSAMDLFLRAEALGSVGMTSTAASGWTIPEIREAVEAEEILYVGKYSAPDYEALLERDCRLAVENTMILHNPETKELLEQLGIPVIVERSSYEPHPLGRLEWIRLYGLLAGTQEEADAFFTESAERFAAVEEQENTGKSVVFFYITSSGYANVRKPGDYIAKMIELAGGEYAFQELAGEEENALSTVNMPLETFYAEAKDADILIYNSTVDGEIASVDELLAKSPLLADFAAVRKGDIWCTNRNMFQQVSAVAELMEDLRVVMSGGEEASLHFLHRIQ